jgi:hypothetical protein
MVVPDALETLQLCQKARKNCQSTESVSLYLKDSGWLGPIFTRPNLVDPWIWAPKFVGNKVNNLS